MKKMVMAVIVSAVLLSGCTIDQVAGILDKTANVVERTSAVVDTATGLVVTTQSMFEKGYNVGQAGTTVRLDKDITVEQFDTAIKTVLSRFNFTGASALKDATLELQEVTADGEMKGVKFYTAYTQEFSDESSVNAPGGVLCRVIYKKPNANAFNIAIAVGVDKDLSQDAANGRAREFAKTLIEFLATELGANLY